MGDKKVRGRRRERYGDDREMTSRYSRYKGPAVDEGGYDVRAGRSRAPEGYQSRDNNARRIKRRSYADASPYRENRYVQGGPYMQPGPEGYYPSGRYIRRKKRRGLKIFLLLLFLIIAAAGVFLASRIMRMDTHSLRDLIVNAGASGRSGYTTIVLYGVDSREGNLTEECHSDSIIICALDRREKKIKLASVYRDTYLDNTNGEYRKATECYYYGGPSRSVSMLNKNLDLNIKDYLTVNFMAMIKAVDLIGGIELEITEEERGYINGYCVENEQVTGVSYTPLEQSGYVHLDGIQALAYCRIRYTEGWDFKRAERQRTVINLVWQKARALGVPAMLSLADAMLPYISTSMNPVELMSLVKDMGSYQMGEETGFPFNLANADLAAGDCVVPVTLSSNVSELHSFLYGESGYVPTETVSQISSEISDATGLYG